ncbi:uroporphyrinogen-III synthase [Caloramator sp. mosi_1]|nr:uroporphyrinogen-III synthase [Caloramator sp. mosi_1]WDC85616.1 uroporphyrinogen-III synthase [Caloramator sp. mosi_1]
MKGSLDDYIDRLSTYHHIIFTSVNGVEIFFEELIDKNVDIRSIKGNIYAIGEKTKYALKEEVSSPFVVTITHRRVCLNKSKIK